MVLSTIPNPIGPASSILRQGNYATPSIDISDFIGFASFIGVGS